MRKIKISILVAICLALVSCKYTFSGASYGTAKTVSIDFFQNLAPIVVPTLSTTFTEGLKDKFIQQTPLEMVTRDADLSFEGEIRDYSVMSKAVTAQEVAAQNRLTITTHVKFRNRIDDKWSFDQNFSAYEDYDSSSSLSSVQDDLIETIVEKLINDIFNASDANW